MPGLSNLSSLWGASSRLKRAGIVAAPLLVTAAMIGGTVLAVTAAGGGDDDAGAQVTAPTATAAPTSTPVPPTPTNEQVLAYLIAIAPTPVPGARAAVDGVVAQNPTTGSAPARQYVPRPGATGPGPITGTDMSISIPVISVQASVYARTMGTNGQMGNPSGAWDVIWYDFSQNYPGLGGYPGQPGANAVFAGHVDYIRVGPAVFYSVQNLQPGDQVTVNTGNGPVTYSIQWSQWAGPNDDFTQFVSQTGEELITLVTCIGGFSAGHYSNRLIVRGVRI